MGLYPVILCGGAGTRLWPESRPSRPKPFLPMSGGRSLFQEAVLRAAPLVQGGRLVVVGGLAHRPAIEAQISALGLTAQLLLEPEPRESAPAMAAAAMWTARRDPAGVNVFIASDHHIPDPRDFQQAVRRAARSARAGRIVTLGVRPTCASSAYGYIRPAAGTGLSRVRAFVEKPEARAAAAHVAAGDLWNSGVFVAAAATVLSELHRHAPEIERAVRRALPDRNAPVLRLKAAFRTAPKLSFDHAVMEKTGAASVLPVDFDWSDLGAWDAMAATGRGDVGAFIAEDSEGCIVRASQGLVVAALGVRNLAIIAERDAVLVCDLSRSQDVKKLVEHLRQTSPQHVDFPVTAAISKVGALRNGDQI